MKLSLALFISFVMASNGKRKFATIAIHTGSEPDSVSGAVVPSISLA